MDLYVSEIGNTKGITLKGATPEKRESVYYNGEEFLIAASFAGFLSTDQKDVLDRYAAFKRMFGEIRDVYENKVSMITSHLQNLQLFSHKIVPKIHPKSWIIN